eukprot:PhF_6_TR36166/c0_g1_i2/m.52628
MSSVVQVKIRHAILSKRGLSNVYVRCCFHPSTSSGSLNRRTAKRSAAQDTQQVTWNEVIELTGSGDLVMEVKEDHLIGHNAVIGRAVLVMSKHSNVENEYVECVLPLFTASTEELIKKEKESTTPSSDSAGTIHIQFRFSTTKSTFQEKNTAEKSTLLKEFIESPSDVIGQGWLSKRSPAWPHMYQQRWVCVKGRMMAYCPPSPNFLEPPVDVDILGVVNLQDCVFTRHPTDELKFSVDGPHMQRKGIDSVYVFKAETATLRDKWQDVFNRARLVNDDLPEIRNLLDLIGEEEIKQDNTSNNVADGAEAHQTGISVQQETALPKEDTDADSKEVCSECGKVFDGPYIELFGSSGTAKLHDECVLPHKIRTRPKCKKCGDPILDNEHIVIESEHYHDQCAPPDDA